MRLSRLIFSLSLACALAGPALAQEAPPPRPAPRVGVALGIVSIPGSFHTGCNGPSIAYPGVELRVAESVGRLAVEGGAGIAGGFTHNDCLQIAPVHEDGIHTDRVSGVRARDWRAHGELLLRWTPLDAPVSLQAGTGVLAPGLVPYLSAGAGVSTRGSIPLRLDVRRRWLLVPFTETTREWEGGQVVRTLGEDDVREVFGGWVVQLGTEFRVR